MRSSYRIFRIKGIEVSLHVTMLALFLMPVLDLFSYGSLAEGASSAFYSLVFLIALFSSVFAHELAHSLVALKNRIKVSQITLTPIGGIASVGLVKDPITEFKISLAGPLTSIGIGILLLAILAPAAGMGNVGKAIFSGDFIDQPSLLNFAILVMYINVILGVFNLFLPIFPMDGGRVLRSMLNMVTSRVKATRIAVYIGQAFLSIFLLFAIIAGSLWLIIIAVFLFLAGLSELKVTEMSEVLERSDLRGIVNTGFIVLSPDFNVSDLPKIAVPWQSVYPVLDIRGKPLGFVDSMCHSEKKGKPGGVKNTTRVKKCTAKEVMSTEFPSLRLNDNKEELLTKVYSSGYAFVLDGKGTLYGILTMQNLQKELKKS